MNEAGRALRLAPLAAALVACTGMRAAQAAPFDVAMPSTWQPGGLRGVAVLFETLRTHRAPVPVHTPRTIYVTSCADTNQATTLRGAIAAAGNDDTVDLRDLRCSSITLTHGAIPAMADSLTIRGPSNSAFAIDGAGRDRVFVHYGSGTLRLEHMTVRRGVNSVSGFHVAGGACILSGGSVTLDHASVRDCVASGEGAYGGGILARTITLYTSTLSGNVALGANPDTFTAAYGGGAMAYFGAIGLYDSNVTGNRAGHTLSDTHGSYCTGGGVFADFGGYALRSTVADNYSYGTGGGLAAHAGIFLTDSTISGNTAKFKPGGGVFTRVVGDGVQLNNSTIVFNNASDGGGIYIRGQPHAVLMQSTIVAKNSAGAAAADISIANPLTIAGTNNLVMAAGAGVILAADTLHDDPLLLPLADNGGPTRTHTLAADSPARNAGANPAGLITDQRGYPRVAGVAADIGAVEMAVAVTAPAAAPTLPTWAAWLLGVLFGCTGWLQSRQRRRMDEP
jgi:hypothetical protein